MRFKRVMLINPQYKGHYPAFLPAGLGYVAEALVHAGIQYDYIDMGLDSSVSKLRNRILSFSPDLLGLQVMSYNYLHTYDLIRQIKKMFPHVRIVVGGHHISSVREILLEQSGAVDYGIVLEGERTIVELCGGRLLLSDIKGLIFRQNGQVVYTGDRQFIEDLDGLPFPKYERFELTRYPSSTIPLTSSRGCPYSCIFCPVKVTIGRQMRIRSATNVVDEIEYWYQRGYRRFGFTDDNFTLYKERVLEICYEIERRGLKDLEFVCGNGVRADKVDRELLTRMRQVGFTWLAFGVEAGNDKVLKRIGKGENIEAIERAISDACELGFDVDLFFLIGSPGETEADIQDSINLALRYPVASVEFYNLIPFPNTELFAWVKENSYFVRSPEEYLNDASHWVNEPVFETPELPFEARRRMFRVCRQVSNEVRRTYIRRKLAKYGILGDFLAYIYVTDFVQQSVLPSTRLRKLARRLYSTMANEKHHSIVKSSVNCVGTNTPPITHPGSGNTDRPSGVNIRSREKTEIRKYYDEVYYSKYSSRKFLNSEKEQGFSQQYYREIVEMLSMMAGETLLDVGCGTGGMLQCVEQKGFRGFGVDYSIVALHRAQSGLNRSVLALSDGSCLPFRSSSFDYVTCLGVLEHIPEMEQAIAELVRVGKGSCKYCIIVPNKWYPLHILGYRTTSQLLNQMLTLSEWKALLEQGGLQVVGTHTDNQHLLCPSSSSRIKHLAKQVVRPLVSFIPPVFAYSIVFYCKKSEGAW